jgi:putative acetyltransferase
MFELARTSSENPDFLKLVKELDKELWERNPNRQSEYVEFNNIDNLQTVVIAYSEGKPVGCGCFKEYDSKTAEIKRMFVPEIYRGKGISKLILAELERWAVELGYKSAVLETGRPHSEAIALYQKAGYIQIENYGQYRNMPNSMCFKKNLL